MLRSFASPGADITVYEKNNLILITDFARNLEKLLAIIDLLDVNLFEKTDISLYPIKTADVHEIAQEMQKIFAALDLSTSGKGVGINFIPIERINSLLVMTSVPQAMEEVEKWLNELDRKESTDEVKNTYLSCEKWYSK